MKEYILCAAIWFDDHQAHEHQPKNIERGFVVCGRRHHNCYAIAFILASEGQVTSRYSELKGSCVQGFLTSRDRFVARAEAAEIALAAKQIDQPVKILFSEHLY